MNDPTLEINAELTAIAEQERALVFTAFDADVAWRLGVALRDTAVREAAALTIEIRVGRQVLFHTASNGAAAINADWVRRKGNTAMHFGRSSYAIGLTLQRDALSIESKYGLSEVEFATQGGAVPLRLQTTPQAAGLASTLVIGSVAVSGLPQREDHRFVVDSIARFLGTAPASRVD